MYVCGKVRMQARHRVEANCSSSDYSELQYLNRDRNRQEEKKIVIFNERKRDRK